MTTLTKTAEQIRGMPAGAEMDCLIATHVMGYTRQVSHGTGPNWTPWEDPTRKGMAKYVWHFYPSSNLHDAWIVMEKMRCLQVSPLGSDKWHACRRQDGDWDCCDWYAIAKTAPLAICRAALLSLAGEVKGEVGL